MKRCRSCLTVNDNRRRKCQACGKKLAVRRRPKHLAALELPYTEYVRINGGEHCGICLRAPSGTRRLHRDHEHTGEGRARGLLCFRCNAALRSYMTVEWLTAAVAYLERTAA